MLVISNSNYMLPGSAMPKKSDIPWLSLWPRVAQTFIGIFFVSASYMKLIDSFFGRGTAPLSNDMHYWLDSGFTVSWYRPVLEFFLPYANWLGVVVILFQGIAGLFLMFDVAVPLAGALLIVLQTNILLGVYNGWGFLAFVGISIWLGFYYLFRNRVYDPRVWRSLSYGLFFFNFVLIRGRFIRGDAWASSFSQHFAHYSQDVMSISPIYKHFVILVSSGSAGPWLWASMWWISVAVFIALFSRYRLQVGALWLIMLTLRFLTWMNGWTGEGVLWVLVAFMWLTQEEAFQRKNGGPVQLFPTISQAWKGIRQFALWVWQREQ